MVLNDFNKNFFFFSNEKLFFFSQSSANGLCVQANYKCDHDDDCGDGKYI